jgi:hypothetical protein
MAINLGSAVLDMSARVARIQGDLGKAAAAIERFKRNTDRVLAGIGAGLSVAGFASFVKGAIDAADNLNDVKRRTGESAQNLLVLQGAAERSGVTFEEVSATLSKLPKRLDEAAKGSGDAAAAFAALGIKVTDSQGRLRSTFDILSEAGRKFSEFEDGTDKANIALAAFGKGGDRLIQMAEEIENTRRRFEELGITIADDTLKQADQFNDTLKDIGSVTRNVGTNLAAALLPTLQKVADLFVDLAKDSRAMAEAFGIVEAAIKGLVTVFGVLGKAIGAILAAAAQPLTSAGFSRAFEILKEGAADVVDSVKSSAGRIGALWSSAAAGVNAYSAATDRAGRKAAPRLPDLAEIKKVNDALLKLLESRAKIELEAQKQLSDQRLKILDRFYGEGLIAERDYWDARQAVQREALAAELTAIGREIAAREKALSKAAPGSSDALNGQRELEEAIARRNRLERDFAFNTQQGYLDASNAARAYRDQVDLLNAELAELQGRSADAAAVRFDQQNRERRQKFETNKDAGALATLDALRAATVAQGTFNETRERGDLLTRQLEISERRIQNSLKVGAISELEALKQTSLARQKSIDELQAVADSMERVARTSGNPKLIADAEEFRVRLEELAASADLLADKFNTIFEDAGGNLFAELTTDIKDAENAFKRFTDSIVRDISRIAGQDLSKQLWGLVGGEGGGGIGGIIAKLFGGGTRAAPARGGFDAGLGSIFGLAFGGFAADGADVFPGMRYKVGEKGAEWFTPDRAGRVDPAGGKAVQVHNHFVLQQPADRRTQVQIGAQAELGTRRGLRNL